jgi:phosphoadenosine phosphosulfate reductase
MNRQLDLKDVNRRFTSTGAAEIIRWAHEEFSDELVMTSGFGDRSAFSLHFVTAIIPNIPVIALDPRFFFPETREFMEELKKRFKLNLKIYYASMSPEEMEISWGRYWENGHADGHAHDQTQMWQYNWIRKEEPLRRAFKQLEARAWIAGVRSYQTANRQELNVVEHRDDGVYKIHPFLTMTEEDVTAYFIEHNLPYHPLVAQDYDSIGDELLTKPGKGREGRSALGPGTECGLHCKSK